MKPDDQAPTLREEAQRTIRVGEARPVPEPAGPPPSETRGAARLGRFFITGALGRGGMGEVLSVRDPDLGRELAAKVILGEASRRAIEKFVLEAQVTGQLEHPSIVPIHELGTAADGRIFYTMKRVQGENLESVLVGLGRGSSATSSASAHLAPEAGRMPTSLPELLQVFLKVCDAVAFAHSNRVIHRDLKPANVMVGRFGEVQVMDWGLAKVVGARDVAEDRVSLDLAGWTASHGLAEDESAPPLRTQDGAICGTPAYMPPEQAAGRVGEIDERSDIYSLGAILYQILALEPPFAGGTRQVLLQVIEGDLVPPSKRAPDRRVPWELEAVVTKAMARRQADRYATVGELKSEVERWLAGQRLAAAAYSPWQVLWKWVLRHKAACAAAAVVVGVLAGIGLTWYLTPGWVRVAVRPLGAEVTLGERSWKAGEKPEELRLRSGPYRLVVRAPEHEHEEREFYLERGTTKDVVLHLVHHKGKLEAEAWPAGSEIAVDGVPYGAVVRNLEFDTGGHRIVAWASEHFERRAEVVLRKDEHQLHYLWLDEGVIWRKPATGIQKLPAHLVADLDGDGAPEFAVQDLLDLVLYSGATGQELARWPAAGNSRWLLRSEDLEGGVGRVLLAFGEEKNGLHVACFDPRRGGAGRFWTFSGPARNWERPARTEIRVALDLTGDGVRELAVLEQDGTLWVLDGRTGQACLPPRRLGVVSPIERFRQLAVQGDRLLYVGARSRPGDRLTGAESWMAAAVRLADGTAVWQRDLGRLQGAACVDLDGDRIEEVFWWSATEWGVLEGRTGAPRAGARIPVEIERTPPEFLDLDGDGVQEVVFVSKSRAVPIRIADGRPLWSHRPLVYSITRVPQGVVVITLADRITLHDPRTGRTLAELPGPRGSFLLADWDGDGKQEIFLGFPREGIRCLDREGNTRWRLRVEGDLAPLLALPDIDGDGLAEIVVAGAGAHVGVIRGPRTLWRRKALGPIRATPILTDTDGDGRLEVISTGSWKHGSLVSFDGATGAVRWGREIHMTTNRRPALADWDGDGKPDVVAIVSRHDAHLRWIRATDGAPSDPVRLPKSEEYAVPAVADLDGDGRPDFAIHRWHAQTVMAISGKTNQPMWTFKTAGPNMGGVAAADLDGDGLPDVVAPSMDGHVYALRGKDGQLLWKVHIGQGGSRAPPELADLTRDGFPEVLVVSQQGRLVVIDGAKGRLLWASDAGTEGLGKPAVARVRGVGTVILAPLGAAGVVAFDWALKRVLWRGPPGRYVQSSPVVADLDGDRRMEVVVTCNRLGEQKLEDAELAVLDLETGDLLWRLHLGKEMCEADPVVADLDRDGIADIVVATLDGELHAVSGLGTVGPRRRLSLKRRESGR